MCECVQICSINEEGVIEQLLIETSRRCLHFSWNYIELTIAYGHDLLSIHST